MANDWDPESYRLLNTMAKDLKWSDRSKVCQRQVPDGEGGFILRGHSRADIAMSKGLTSVSGDPRMINLDEQPCACCQTKYTETPHHPLDPKITGPDPEFGKKDIPQAPQPKLVLVGEL